MRHRTASTGSSAADYDKTMSAPGVPRSVVSRLVNCANIDHTVNPPPKNRKLDFKGVAQVHFVLIRLTHKKEKAIVRRLRRFSQIKERDTLKKSALICGRK